MDVTVTHLQATGIGRTVNVLRKDDGEVGSLAKSLISKWKQMVAAESSDYSEEGKLEETTHDTQEDIVIDSSHKLHNRNNEQSSRSSSSHSKQINRLPDQQSSRKHSTDDVSDASIKKRSHDSDRSGHKTSSHHKDDRHRKLENHVDGENSDKKPHRHSNSEHQHRKNNDATEHVSSSSSHKRHRDQETEHRSSKKSKCDSTTSPSSSSKDKKSSKNKHKSADDGIEIDHSMGTSFADALGKVEILFVCRKKKKRISNKNFSKLIQV